MENLGVQWSAMVALVEAANDRALDTAGSENDSDSVGSQTAMGTKLRATADTVSKPEIKQALLSWASVAEKSAQLQRYLSKHPDTPISEVQSHTQENVILLDQATGSLAQMCPGLPAALAPSKG
ncbi:hypothetical protein AWC04_17335 [Mycolicibacterium fallax]|uniref:Uncharacterized protein n=1 Tax=Mycolicibacterium fallax TaxID=1793 RepID=A0A1X1R3T3_MYCFA|nr:hypothetical protein AWC04_17335 [Mycolicibacterium fallax]